MIILCNDMPEPPSHFQINLKKKKRRENGQLIGFLLPLKKKEGKNTAACTTASTSSKAAEEKERCRQKKGPRETGSASDPVILNATPRRGVFQEEKGKKPMPARSNPLTPKNQMIHVREVKEESGTRALRDQMRQNRDGTKKATKRGAGGLKFTRHRVLERKEDFQKKKSDRRADSSGAQGERGGLKKENTKKTKADEDGGNRKRRGQHWLIYNIK